MVVGSVPSSMPPGRVWVCDSLKTVNNIERTIKHEILHSHHKGNELDCEDNSNNIRYINPWAPKVSNYPLNNSSLLCCQQADGVRDTLKMMRPWPLADLGSDSHGLKNGTRNGTRILTKVQFEKEICTNYFFLIFLL